MHAHPMNLPNATNAVGTTGHDDCESIHHMANDYAAANTLMMDDPISDPGTRVDDEMPRKEPPAQFSHSAGEEADEDEVTPEQIGYKFVEAFHALRSFAGKKNQQMTHSISEEFDQMQSQISRLSEQVTDSSSATQSHLRNTRISLENKLKDCRERLALLGQSSGDAWRDVSHGLSKAIDDLRESLRSAQSRL